MGVNLNLSKMTACNQANRKCNLALSTGYLSVLCWDRTVLNVLVKAALIPSGGSNTNLYDDLINVAGTLGLNSIVKKILKLALGVNLNSFFSKSFSQEIARWTFFNMTHVPPFTP